MIYSPPFLKHAKKLVAVAEAAKALKKANYRDCVYNTYEEHDAFQDADNKFTKALKDLEEK